MRYALRAVDMIVGPAMSVPGGVEGLWRPYVAGA